MSNATFSVIFKHRVTISNFVTLDMKGFLNSFAVFESLKVRLVKVASIAKNLIVRRLKKSYTCFEVSSQEKNDEFLSTPALFFLMKILSLQI